jgi:hypothetical protein
MAITRIPIKRNPSTGKSEVITVNANNVNYSDEILVENNKGFASLILKIEAIDKLLLPTINVYIQYTIPGSGLWSDSIAIETGISATNAEVKIYRLDIVLGQNWLPNVPFRLHFTETGTTGGYYAEGEYVA